MIVVLVVCVFVLNLLLHVAGKAFVPKKRVDPMIESVTLEPELEEALASASDAELCDIAGNILTPSSQKIVISGLISFSPKSCKAFQVVHEFFNRILWSCIKSTFTKVLQLVKAIYDTL